MLDIAERKKMIQKIAELSDEQKQALSEKMVLPVTTEGHQISFINTMLLGMQGLESPTIIGGFNQWIAAGRVVKEGEHGRWIRRPITKNVVDEETGDEDSERFFIWYPAFDITQTEELTEEAKSKRMARASAKPRMITAKFQSVCSTCEKTIRRGDSIAWTKGQKTVQCQECYEAKKEVA